MGKKVFLRQKNLNGNFGYAELSVLWMSFSTEKQISSKLVHRILFRLVCWEREHTHTSNPHFPALLLSSMGAVCEADSWTLQEKHGCQN